MARAYTLGIRRRALKQLQDVPQQFRVRIETKIDALLQTPYPAGCKKLTGGDGLWRIRISDYRVIYLVDEVSRTIDIRAVGHRREIYD